MSEPMLTEGPGGFAWGPVLITRRFSIGGRVSLSLETDSGREIHIYVSATGRSVRLFENGRELSLAELPLAPEDRP